MLFRSPVRALALAATVGFVTAVWAEEPKKAPEPTAFDRDHVVREATVRLGATELRYASVAGTLPLKNEEGKERARIFFTAYSRLPGSEPATRPITFVFNGGPGSSSVWLHLGCFGPKVVELDAEGFATAVPGRLIENPHSNLDLTDLVFIDPPTTGYSRIASGESASQFHGLDEDVEAVGEFIRLYCTHFKRWASPKFVAGESYGTTRAAALSRHLQDRHGMYLNGVILISAILDFRTAETDPGNDLAFLLQYPTCTATAFHHGKLDPTLGDDLPKILRDVEARVLGPWNVAFAKGDALPAAERAALAADIGRYLGVSEAFVLECNLRISLGRFQKELLRDRRRSVGRLDSRFTGIDSDAAGDSTDYDPSYANILGPYSAALNDYVRRELGYESELPYEILTGRVQPWNWGNARNRYVNVATRLRDAMTKNPHLHVFVAGGWYDFATPYFASWYVVDHLGLDPTQTSRVHRAEYPAGHMMYIQWKSLEKMKQDLVGFYRAAAK
jgi:carboxypeptidase C (cathepsin A)